MCYKTLAGRSLGEIRRELEDNNTLLDRFVDGKEGKRLRMSQRMVSTERWSDRDISVSGAAWMTVGQDTGEAYSSEPERALVSGAIHRS